MAEDSETMKVKMLRTSGSNETIQWFEYRPSFNVDIVRVEWELDTMDVELDSPVADYLLRAGYAAPIPQGSPPVAAKPTAPPPGPPQSSPAPAPKSQEPTADPPPSPSWLKPNGGD
jgi:hypothetical protein